MTKTILIRPVLICHTVESCYKEESLSSQMQREGLMKKLIPVLTYQRLILILKVIMKMKMKTMISNVKEIKQQKPRPLNSYRGVNLRP